MNSSGLGKFQLLRDNEEAEVQSRIAKLGLSRSVRNARLAVQPSYSLSSALELNKPYFGRRLAAFQSPPVRYALVDAVVRSYFSGKRSARILEIGSWAGASAITFGLALRDLGMHDSTVVCVDHWERYLLEQDGHYESMNSAAASGDIQRLFWHNVRACDLIAALQVKEGRSADVLPQLEPESFDLVYVDGSHNRDDVAFDIEQAKRLVRDNGIICGDDLELCKAETDQLNHADAVRLGTDYVTDPRSGIRYHPGVTEAVAEAFTAVRQEYGVWLAERAESGWLAPTFPIQGLNLPPHLRHAVEVPYGIYKGYTLFQLGEAYVAYPISGPDWFQRRLTESSLEDLVLLIDSIEEINQGRTSQIIEIRHGFNILAARGKVWVIAQNAGEIDLADEEKVQRLLAANDLFQGQTIDDARAWVDEFSAGDLRRPESNPPVGVEGISRHQADHIIEARHGYNILSARGNVWAIAQQAGEVDVSNEQRVRRLLEENQLFKGQTIDDARAWVDEMIARYPRQSGPSATPAEGEVDDLGADHIVEERHGYNLLAARGKVWAIAQRAGEVDVSDQEQVHRLLAEKDLFEAATIDDARVWVDEMTIHERQRNHADLEKSQRP